MPVKPLVAIVESSAAELLDASARDDSQVRFRITDRKGEEMAFRVTHFEIPVDDPDRAEKFYSEVFGWTFNRFPGAPSYYGLTTTGEDTEPGINGALYQRGNMTETVVSVSVDSVDDISKKLADAGGQVVQEKMPIPGMGWYAYCTDIEGNPIGLFQSDPSAQM